MSKVATPERALRREMDRYRWRTGRLIRAGIGLLIAGGAAALFFTPEAGPHPDLWLYRRFGEKGLEWGGRGVGGVLVVVALLLFFLAYRRHASGLSAREASSRAALGLPEAANVNRPSQAIFLLGILIVVLAVAAIYYLHARHGLH